MIFKDKDCVYFFSGTISILYLLHIFNMGCLYLCCYKQSYTVLSQVLCIPFTYLDYVRVPFPHVHFLQPLN